MCNKIQKKKKNKKTLIYQALIYKISSRKRTYDGVEYALILFRSRARVAQARTDRHTTRGNMMSAPPT